MESHPMTSPQPSSARNLAQTNIITGIATKFWLELIAYPQGTARSLWLMVDNDWKKLDNPADSIQASVQDAFSKLDTFEVEVLYENQDIKGLLVRSK